MKKYCFYFITVLLLFVSCRSNKLVDIQKLEKKYVLLVSFDGFRYDYPEKFNLPNFKKLKEKSSYAKGVISSFPSKTFPNHYSIITGMYPGNHGLVDNKFYSPSQQKIYSIPDRSVVRDASFYGGIPLWQWLQQKGMKTASYFWVGSEAPIGGVFPTYYKQFNDKIPYKDRINQVFQWFELPEEERPRFITLYFEFIDHIGHHTGTNSEELRKALNEADDLLGEIMRKVDESNLSITTIITSDHGMIDMQSDDKHIVQIGGVMEKLEDKAEVINNGMHCQIYLKDKKDKEKIYKDLKKVFSDKPFVKVYKKEETPVKWNYRKHSNIGDLLLITDAPYYMVKNNNDFWAKKKGIWGTHGYDPYTTPEMMAIFYVYGEGIKENNLIPSFENIHIYPFINKVLGVRSPKNIDGKTAILTPVFKEK